MMKSAKTTLLYSALILCTALLIVQPVSAQERSIKVGAYGGYFKDSFDKHIFPDFTKETGIKVESVADPTVRRTLRTVVRPRNDLVAFDAAGPACPA